MKIFIPTYGGGHVNIVIPISKVLKERGYNITILALPAAIGALKRNNVEFKTFKDYLDIIEEKEKIVSIGKKLANLYHNDNAEIDYMESVLYYGIGMYDLIMELGQIEANNEFERLGRKAFLPKNIMKKIIEHESPQVIFTTCSQRVEKAAQLVAKEKNILSIRALDTPYIPKDNLLNTDYIFCLNEYQKSQLILMGINTNHIIPVGQPAFDELFKNRTTKKELCNQLNIDFNKPLLLWGSGVTKESDKNTKGIINLAKHRKDINIIVKLHPTSEEIETFKEKYNDDIPENIILLKEFCIHNLLKASDIILTQYSTVGYEAILLDKQLVIVNLGKEDYPIKYYENQAAWLVEDEEDIEDTIISVLSDMEISDKIKEGRVQYKIVGEGAVQVVNNIERLYKNRIKE